MCTFAPRSLICSQHVYKATFYVCVYHIKVGTNWATEFNKKKHFLENMGTSDVYEIKNFVSNCAS